VGELAVTPVSALDLAVLLVIAAALIVAAMAWRGR
jgi:hypothetical protein